MFTEIGYTNANYAGTVGLSPGKGSPMNKPYSGPDPLVRDDRGHLLSTNQRDSLVRLLQRHPEPARLHKQTGARFEGHGYVTAQEGYQMYLLTSQGRKLAARITAEVAAHRLGSGSDTAPQVASLETTNLLQLVRVFELEAENAALREQAETLRIVVGRLIESERLHLDSLSLFIASTSGKV